MPDLGLDEADRCEYCNAILLDPPRCCSKAAGRNLLQTKDDLLNAILRKNRYGVWFICVDSNELYTLPRWMWPFLEKILPGFKTME